MPNTVFDEFVVLTPGLRMDALTLSEDFYLRLDENYDGFRNHTLVSAHHFTKDWQEWEIHPRGDEMVVLLSGRARFKLRKDAGEETVTLGSAGAFLIVPANTWHTAMVDEPCSVLFITPGQDTRNATEPNAG